jgi:hypothetical protein
MPLSAQDKQDLVALEHAMWSEETRFDLPFQEKRFAADFMEFGRSGRTYTRAQIIRTDRSPIEAKLKNLAVHELDSSTVLITYKSEASFGNEIEHALRSSVWVRTVSGWQMRFHQGTPCQPNTSVTGHGAA